MGVSPVNGAQFGPALASTEERLTAASSRQLFAGTQILQQPERLKRAAEAQHAPAWRFGKELLMRGERALELAAELHEVRGQRLA